MIEPMQLSPDGRVTIQYIDEKYRIEFLDRPSGRVLFLTEVDMIDIFNAIRFEEDDKEWEHERSWKVIRVDNEYLLKSKKKTMCKWNGRLRRVTAFWKLT
jgi:hypothetical protein